MHISPRTNKSYLKDDCRIICRRRLLAVITVVGNLKKNVYLILVPFNGMMRVVLSRVFLLPVGKYFSKWCTGTYADQHDDRSKPTLFIYTEGKWTNSADNMW